MLGSEVSPDKISVVVVDDETASRARLLDLFKKQSDFEIAGVGRNGNEAVQLIRSASPDLVVLEAQMSGLDGFGVLQEVTPQYAPLAVFVSSSDKYAMQAFEAHAIDYILKPFSDERVESALERARDYIRMQTTDHLARRLVGMSVGSNGSVKGAGYLKRIAIKSGGRVIFLNVRDIDWIEAAGVYVYLHVGPKPHLYRTTVRQLQEKLDPESFVRVHRSTIVNGDRILELNPRTHGDYGIILKDRTELTLSRGYRTQVEAWLRQSL
jgi:two-component system LytT family response regulator